MAQTCATCKYSREYSRPIFRDGNFDTMTTEMTCINKESNRWYRLVNNLITCDKWETK